MRRTSWLNFLLALILLSPLLFQLAEFPQNPDGAEMLNTALYGGVMHPSGMPLQAWINRAAVAVSPFSPGWTLSLVSWLGHVGAVFFLLQLLVKLGVSPWVQVFTVSAFAYLPVLWRLALQPEKYTWLCFALMMALYASWNLLNDDRKRGLLFLAVACALVNAQHSSGLIVFPSFVFALAYHLRRKRSDALAVGGAILIFVFLTVGLYISLLALRADEPVVWVDWGHLESLLDVWRHYQRADYSVLQLHHQADTASTINGLDMMARQLRSFPFGVAMFFIGGYVAFVRNKGYAIVVGLLLLGALAILKLAELPADDLQTTYGYAERYPTLCWPMTVLWMAFGLDWLLTKFSALRPVLLIVAAFSLFYLVITGGPAALAVNNNLIDIYRREVVRELPAERVLFSSSDYELFYGFPCDQVPCYPLKNMFAYGWYRDLVAPGLEPKVKPVLNSLGLGWPLPDFFRAVLSRNLTLVSTSATAMLPYQDIMNSAEQVGVLWIFKYGPQQLYSERIIQNSLSICRGLQEAWTGIPEDGNFFAQEVLQNFRFAIQGAADYLNATERTIAGGKADALAKSLRPGVQPAEWIRLCQAYQASF